MQISAEEVGAIAAIGTGVGYGIRVAHQWAKNGRGNGMRCPYHKDLQKKVERIEHAITGENGIRVVLAELKKDIARLCEEIGGLKQ